MQKTKRHCFPNKQQTSEDLCLLGCDTMKMEVEHSFELSLNIYHTTGHHIPQGSNLHGRHEHLKAQIKV
jgi:hypothetical protein